VSLACLLLFTPLDTAIVFVAVGLEVQTCDFSTDVRVPVVGASQSVSKWHGWRESVPTTGTYNINNNTHSTHSAAFGPNWGIVYWRI
jgi:hypothetical protein